MVVILHGYNAQEWDVLGVYIGPINKSIFSYTQPLVIGYNVNSSASELPSGTSSCLFVNIGQAKFIISNTYSGVLMLNCYNSNTNSWVGWKEFSIN